MTLELIGNKSITGPLSWFNLVKSLNIFDLHNHPQGGLMGYEAGKLYKEFQRAHPLRG